MSPDGRKFLNRNTRTVYDVLTMETFELPIQPRYPAKLVWLPGKWLLSTEGQQGLVPDNTPREVCPGAMPTRLAEASYAKNPTTTPNNLRVEPSLSSELAGSLAAGETAQIIVGPQCADGLVWWYVMANAMGWIAEGANGEYFLVPVR